MRALPRVITRAASLAAGVSDDAVEHRIARHQWVRLHAGVYFTRGPEPTYRDRLEGAVLAGGRGAALSGAAALSLVSLRDVPPPPRPLVLVGLRSGTVSTAAARFRRTDVPFRPRRIDGVVTAGIARALADHCREVRRLDTVQALVSEAVRRRLCSVDELAQAYRLGAQRGSRNLRMAIEDVALGAWSLPEARAGRALRAAGVPEFVQNARLMDASGRVLAIADVYWEALRAAVEIHGADTHQSAQAWAETLRRAARVATVLGIEILHVPAIDVLRDLDSVVERIVQWLDQLGRRGTRLA